MPTIKVTPSLIRPNGTYYRLILHFDGREIGEYEKSVESQIQRKIEEVQCAAPLLLDLFSKHGPLIVRWNDSERQKEIRNPNGKVVGSIPRGCWRG